MWGRLWDALYPPRCVACGRLHADSLCPSCAEGIALIQPPACGRCGMPRRDLGECLHCLGRTFAFDSIVCAGFYQGSLRRAILNLKFRRWRRAAAPLAQLLWQVWSRPEYTAWRQVDALVPVPIHPVRRALRGFNQAELIAQSLSQLSGVPVLMRALRRRFYRRPQVGLRQAERMQNVKDAFEVARPNLTQGRTFALLDDVFTTGSTLNACAHALREGGALRVVVLAVARDLSEDKPTL
ncbi:MAG: ComF family protein [Fimbriimonadales bacterium]|nr:ComF family protein [Fimbriimonadales bacterium]